MLRRGGRDIWSVLANITRLKKMYHVCMYIAGGTYTPFGPEGVFYSAAATNASWQYYYFFVTSSTTAESNRRLAWSVERRSNGASLIWVTPQIPTKARFLADCMKFRLRFQKNRPLSQVRYYKASFFNFEMLPYIVLEETMSAFIHRMSDEQFSINKGVIGYYTKYIFICSSQRL